MNGNVYTGHIAAAGTRHLVSLVSATAVIVTVCTVTACTPQAGTASPEISSTSISSPASFVVDVTPSSTGPSLSPAPPPRSPEEIAIRWLIAYRSAQWTDAGPGDWIDRVRPYVTATQHRRDAATRHGSRGADWPPFVAAQCRTRVFDVAGVVPPEAPNTKTTRYVQATGTVRTTCNTRTPIAPTEDVEVTLALTKTRDGWRVAGRIY